jgi:hypothetical protein
MRRSVVALVVVTASACGTTAADAPSDDGGAADVRDARADHWQKSGDDGGPAPPTGPDHLADTGLYKDFASRTIDDGIVAYTPRWPLWSDGADKTRYIYLPPGTKIDSTYMDEWYFPVGTKVWKEFRVQGRLVETRLLWKTRDGDDGWWEVAYAWNADGTDAVAAPSGIADALSTTHDIPSQQDCGKCHGNVEDVLIGIGAIQLGASDGDGTFAKLVAEGAFTAPPPVTTYDVPGMGVVKEALGYLHGNCGHCHNDLGRLQQQTGLRLRLGVNDKVAEQTPPYRTAIGLTMVHDFQNDAGQLINRGIIPGEPERSELWWRMTQRGDVGMPPVCTKVVDDKGVATIHDWIAQMRCGVFCTAARGP